MDAIASAVTSVTVRILTRYLNAAFIALSLGDAASGDALIGNPQVQAFLTVLIGGLIAWLVERATVLARRYGQPT